MGGKEFCQGPLGEIFTNATSYNVYITQKGTAHYSAIETM